MSKPDTWMPLYIGDYIADTMHLTTEEHGAYLLLLMTAWNRGGKLPNNDAQLALICRAERKAWSRLRGVVLAFFEVDGEFLVQPRLAKEYENAVRLNAKQKANGAKGGRPKKTQPESQSASQQETQTETQTKPVGFCWDNPDAIPDETPSPSPNTSVANATGGKPPKVTDPDEIIFGYGVPLLTAAGNTDRASRSFLGGLRKNHGDEAVVAALRDCIKAKPLQPLEWLAAALPPSGSNGRSRKAPVPENFDAVDYGVGGLL